MKPRHFLASLVSAFAVMTAPAAHAADTYTLDPEHSYVSFKISHFGFSSPSGKWFANGTLVLDQDNPQNSKANITIKVKDIVTGIPELDDHLRTKDFFEVSKYPTATFVSDHVNLTGNQTADVQGTLTVHGISRPITLHVKLNKHGMHPMTDKISAGFTATAALKRSEFGITTYLPGLGDDVKLEIEAEAGKNA